MRPHLRVVIAVVLLSVLVWVAAVPGGAVVGMSDLVVVSLGYDGLPANGTSGGATVSFDGSTVVFFSSASDLVEGDINDDVESDMSDDSDVFAYDVRTGTTRLFWGPEGEGRGFESMSYDETVIVYEVRVEEGFHSDVVVYDDKTGETELVSVGYDGSPANGWSVRPSVSGDGSTVVYVSTASNLVPGDTNESFDVFAYDVASGSTTLISHSSEKLGEQDEPSAPSVSADGTLVAYASYASDLVEGDTNDEYDVFMYDRTTGTTTMVSKGYDGGPANGMSAWPLISGDGSTIVYSSFAPNLVAGDTNNDWDVFTYAVRTGTTALVTKGYDGSPAIGGSSHGSISHDGSLITIQSGGNNLVPEDTGTVDVFVYEESTGTISMLSQGYDGTLGNATSQDAIVSGDGSTVVFSSGASNLVEGDNNGAGDVFLTWLTTVDNPFYDDNWSMFEDDIEWLAIQGITLGCNPDGSRYCPDEPTTRAQTATFLARALNLPPVEGNRFDDVFGTHLANINAIAEAGITVGCTADGTMFCPDESVTRAQMASFLARALNLEPVPGDRFDDVTGVHEPNINAIADAGITLGCDPDGTMFCPDDPVTRGQMAAFLHRALAG